MTVRISVRIPDELHHELDQLVQAGVHHTRAEAIRAAITAYVTSERRRAVDEAIVEGYRRIPPTEHEEAWVTESTREMLTEEQW